MIDFSTLQGLATPRGVVTQIEDAAGRVLWAISTGFDGTFKVKKITSNTYAGSTTYSNEEFILLSIYPKSGGTVSVTYGDLTKTITDTSGAEEPNAQLVYFGTFNGVADEVETPASGILTITGDWRAAGCGSYTKAKSTTAYCSCITEIGDLSGIETIPDHAFYGCEIESVKIADGVKTIENRAFDSCNVMKSVVIPGSVTEIGEFTFSYCDTLSRVTIKNGVKKIGKGMFAQSPKVKVIDLPDSVTEIGENAFGAMVKTPLNINMNNNVERIGSGAFGNREISDVQIPASTTEIGVNPWRSSAENCNITVSSENTAYKIDGNCLIEISSGTIITGFADSVIPSYIKTIGEEAFYLKLELKNINIPNGVTEIATYAFAYSGLESVEIPESIEVIKENAFANCTNLQNVVISDGVTEIDNAAFMSCASLQNVVIPASVTKVGSVFYGCTNLLNVTMLATTPPTRSGTSKFVESGTTITVPVGCGDVYKATEGWSDYADRIVEES